MCVPREIFAVETLLPVIRCNILYLLSNIREIIFNVWRIFVDGAYL